MPTHRVLTMVIAMTVGAWTAPARSADDAGVIQERLVVTPLAPARVGDELTAIVHLHNPSAKPVTTRVQLSVDGEPHVTQRVAVAAGARVPVPLRLYLDEPKSYRVSTGELETTFKLFPADMAADAKRQAARGRQRRIIYNNDGGDALYHRDIRTLLDVSTAGLAGSHVDTIAYCTVGGLTFWHDSRVGQIADRGAFDALRKTRGIDPLELQIEFARKHGIEIFWSMRMNDTHDTVDVWNWLMPQWKRDHPQFLVGERGKTYPWGAGNWTALDYNHRGARDYIFEVIEDVAKRYDVDGIELDFYRGEPFFKEQLLGEPITDAQRERMMDLMRRLAEVVARENGKRSRPLMLAVRVPDSLAYCRDIGLDVEAWLRAGYVDLLFVGGDHRYEPWENMVRLGHQYDRPVYACLAGDYLTQEESDWEAQWRGHAINAWRSGVDGIYTFNFLQHRHALFRQMGDLKTLEATDAVYQFTPGTYWGFLKGELDYIHAVRIEPPSGPFAERLEVTLTFPPGGNHEIRYTTDGSPPTRDSRLYDGPVVLKRDAVVQARSYAPDGVASPVMSERYHRVHRRFLPPGDAMPLDFFGLPNGAELSVTFDLPALERDERAMLYLSMMDVDAPREAMIRVNDGPPSPSPDAVLSGSMVRDGTLAVPADQLKPGRNVVTFTFDNLNEGTSGFRVYRVELVTLRD